MAVGALIGENMQKRKNILYQSRQVLTESGRFLESVIGFSICAFGVMFMLLCSSLVVATFEEYLWKTEIALVFLTMLSVLMLFVAWPIIFGYLNMMRSIYKRERDVYVIDIFKPFTSIRLYFKSVLLGVSTAIRAFICYIAPLILALSLYLVLEEIDPFSKIGIMSLFHKLYAFGAFVILFLLLSFLFSGGYLGIYNTLGKNKEKRPYRQSRKLLKGRRLRTMKIKLIFMGTVAVSLLTVGALFIFTVPMMVISYFIYAEQVTENIIE